MYNHIFFFSLFQKKLSLRYKFGYIIVVFCNKSIMPLNFIHPHCHKISQCYLSMRRNSSSSLILFDKLNYKKKKYELFLAQNWQHCHTQTYRPNALNNDTISVRRSFNIVRHLSSCPPFLGTSTSTLDGNRIFSAVPNPCTCSLPHSRHLSQPTQSIIFEIFRNFSLNSALILSDS